MKKRRFRKYSGNKREKARSKKRKEKCQLPDPFLSLRSKDGRTGAKRNACQKEKGPAEKEGERKEDRQAGRALA